jgi:NADPH:quinone reductase-like Zn-dependent oxidoreductase
VAAGGVLSLHSGAGRVVEGVATDVEGFSVGDEILGMVRFPSMGESAAYAEYVAAPASDLALKPAGIDHVHRRGADGRSHQMAVPD